MGERNGHTPDEAEGFQCENGQWVEYPDPLNGSYDTPEGMRASIDAAEEIAYNPEVYGERLAGLNRHYLNFYARLNSRKGRGRWRSR